MVNSVVMERSRPAEEVPRAVSKHEGVSRERPYPWSRPQVAGSSGLGLLLGEPSLLGLSGILDGLKSLEFDVIEFAVDLLDLGDVDVLYDVAGFRIDRDRAARAFPLHPLHGV